MGIGGHILGPRKLRKLAAPTGLPLDRAYIRNGYSEGVVWTADGCEHYRIDPKSGEHQRIGNPAQLDELPKPRGGGGSGPGHDRPDRLTSTSKTISTALPRSPSAAPSRPPSPSHPGRGAFLRLLRAEVRRQPEIRPDDTRRCRHGLPRRRQGGTVLVLYRRG